MLKLQSSSQPYLKLLITIVLVLGLFFRFVNIDKKSYWNDEVFTSLRISGYRYPEVAKNFNSRVITAKEFQKYQYPNSEKSVVDTIKGLAKEEPQLPPLYFVMARGWVEIFGHSIAVTRSLSAWISLLAFPCLYWLCLELFNSPMVGGVAMALMAVSPIHVLYAQEARPYSLWTVIILLSSAALLRAMRVKTKLSWGLYAATLGIGLYTHLFTGLIAIGHGIYVAIVERFRLSQAVISYLLASLVGILTFIPWLALLIANRSKANSATAGPQTDVLLLSLFKNWLVNFSLIFVDLDYRFHGYQLFLGFLILIFVLYSFYVLHVRAPQKSFVFIMALIGVTGLVLVFPDLILMQGGKSGSRLSTLTRYIIPCYLGFQMSVAYLIATQMRSQSIHQQQRWKIIFIVLLAVGILSCFTSSQATTWWNKGGSIHNTEVANIINRSPSSSALIIGDPIPLLSLSHRLNPDVSFLSLSGKEIVPDNFQDFRTIFLYRLEGTELLSRFKLPYRLDKMDKYKIVPYRSWETQLSPARGFRTSLWKIETNN
jgi:uncharacterized membrane protein